MRAFFEDLRRLAHPKGGFEAILEVCGFNDWLLQMLTEYGCRETVLIQAEKRGDEGEGDEGQLLTFDTSVPQACPSSVKS